MHNESTISKNEIIAQLCRSPHGKYEEYLPVAQRAVTEEPAFLSHLIAWNAIKGQIRDSKVALPVGVLSVKWVEEVFTDNALAHLALLDPRNLMKAYTFHRSIKSWGHTRMKQMILGYLEKLESNIGHWERVALQHRRTLKSLYALTHAKRSEYVGAVLFGGEGSVKSGKAFVKAEYPKGSLFWVVANLKHMDPLEAAGMIMTRRIPFLIAIGALGEKAKTPELVQALIGRMSATELTNNSKMLEGLGIRTVPALRAAYAEAIVKAGKSKVNTLKASVAAEEVEDPVLKAQLKALQEKQIESIGGIEGDWLVMADKSTSMRSAIEVARYVASTLTGLVKGKVYLLFFDSSCFAKDVTGKSLDEIKKDTEWVMPHGNTSIGAPMRAILDRKVRVDGIAVVSDGGHNTLPSFSEEYKKYAKVMDVEPTVYFYQLNGDPDKFTGEMKQAGLDMQTFPLGSQVDYYALPNLAKTMRISRYSLIDEIMNTPLLRLEDVLKQKGSKKGELQHA